MKQTSHQLEKSLTLFRFECFVEFFCVIVCNLIVSSANATSAYVKSENDSAIVCQLKDSRFVPDL